MANVVPASGSLGVNIVKVQKGSATILAGNNSVTVIHTLGSASIQVLLTPTNDLASQGVEVINKTVTTFDIAFAFGAVQPGGNATFDYFAV